MNPTRTLVSALTSFVRSACVAVFTHPSTATHASSSQAEPAAPPPPSPKHGQSVLVREAPRFPAVTAPRRGGRPRRPTLTARSAAKLQRLLPILADADNPVTSLGTGFTKLDTIRALERSISKARRQGYTLAHIAQALTDNGLPLTRATLGVYLLRISKPTPSTHARLIPDSFVASTDGDSSESRPFIADSFFASTDGEAFEDRPAFPPCPLPL